MPLVKRVAGLLVPRGNDPLLTWGRDAAARLLGPIQREAGPFPFDWTDYYRGIAPELDRYLFSFDGLAPAEGLAGWKRAAVGIERESARLSGDGSPPARRINLDPGWIDGARLVLASTKDHAHRIYLGGGIFAEVTLRFRKGRPVSFDYTFPDFRSGRYDSFLVQVREDWRRERPGRDEDEWR
jgi:hypothetical protein